MVAGFFQRGWAKVPFDATVLEWVRHAEAPAQQAMAAPNMAQWWVCENTWFVGVDALDTDGAGALSDGPPLAGAAKTTIEGLYGIWPQLPKAQVSVIRPGYPKPRAGESAAAFEYRRDRDAAHVDGLKRFGDAGGRRIDETHAWILGLPLTNNTETQAPLVVWEGSHEIMRRALGAALAQHPEQEWPLVDVSAAYRAARREVFDTCARIVVSASPGAGYVLHRLCLHGVAPWHAESASNMSQRVIAYFRPTLSESVRSWIDSP